MALRRELRLPDPRREVLVSAVPLQISIERGPDDGALRIIIDGFDPIPIAPASRIIVRPEGHGVVLEREA